VPQVQQDKQQPAQQQQQPPPHNQQQQHHTSTPQPRRRRPQPARDPGVVDEQWALLTRNAVPSASAAAAAAVPGDLADMAHVVGRGGLPLPELLAKAAQQTIELGVTNRPRAILLEPVEVGPTA
jgi:hypothetical protein